MSLIEGRISDPYDAPDNPSARVCDVEVTVRVVTRKSLDALLELLHLADDIGKRTDPPF
jgi:hypothetical protein